MVKGKQNFVKLNQAELILTWGMGGNYGNKNSKIVEAIKRKFVTTKEKLEWKLK